MTRGGERIDIYSCNHPQQMQRVVDVLAGVNIEGLVRNRGSSVFPMTVGTESRQIVAVRQQEIEPAIAAIRQAMADDVVLKEGDFLVKG